MRRGILGFAGAALPVLLSACTSNVDLPARTERMKVTVQLADGTPLPGAGDAPLPIPTDGRVEVVADIEAEKADGSVDTSFQGYVRLSAEPGAVVSVVGPGATGRNALLKDGAVQGVHVTLDQARGPMRVWVEDIGYVPADPFKPPACSDGKDNDGDGLVDYPVDPGCAFANDDTETPGNFAAGVSPPVYFALPRLSDIQGHGATTPYPEQAVQAMTADPAKVIVTRIASDGFYATDVTDTDYNHIFAFTFSTPGGVRVCDRVTQLSGTAADFFGFTELSFPSYEVHPWVFPDKNNQNDGPCLVPDPWIIDTTNIGNPAMMESHESALVRVQGASVGQFFGPDLALNNSFGPTKSNCDFDGSGAIDFSTGSAEGACANACSANAECSEWSEYLSRGNFLVRLSTGEPILVNTATISGFDPPSMRGKKLAFVTGTMRNFSGGSHNWTIETRCPDDLVCDDASQPACQNGPKAPVGSDTACVSPRTINDPNEASN